MDDPLRRPCISSQSCASSDDDDEDETSSWWLLQLLLSKLVSLSSSLRDIVACVRSDESNESPGFSVSAGQKNRLSRSSSESDCDCEARKARPRLIRSSLDTMTQCRQLQGGRLVGRVDSELDWRTSSPTPSSTMRHLNPFFIARSDPALPVPMPRKQAVVVLVLSSKLVWTSRSLSGRLIHFSCVSTIFTLTARGRDTDTQVVSCEVTCGMTQACKNLLVV